MPPTAPSTLSGTVLSGAMFAGLASGSGSIVAAAAEAFNGSTGVSVGSASDIESEIQIELVLCQNALFLAEFFITIDFRMKSSYLLLSI